MPKEIFPSSYECDCGHQSHFSENTIREIKAMSRKKKVRLGDSEPDERLNYESVKPYCLKREDRRGEVTSLVQPKPRLIARKESGVIEIDTAATLRGVPPEAWQYQFWPSQRATAFGDMHIQLNGSRPALPLDCAAAPGKRHNPKSTA